MSHGLSRRQFIAGVSASAASAMIVPRHVLGRGRQAPSDTLNIAGIGGRRARTGGCAGVPRPEYRGALRCGLRPRRCDVQ